MNYYSYDVLLLNDVKIDQAKIHVFCHPPSRFVCILFSMKKVNTYGLDAMVLTQLVDRRLCGLRIESVTRS